MTILSQGQAGDRRALRLLWSASEELELIGVIHHSRFTHDYESALESLRRAARSLLHSRVLDALIGTDTPREAELAQRLEAGASLTQLHLHSEANAQFERARFLLEHQLSSVARANTSHPCVQRHNGSPLRVKRKRLYRTRFL